MTPENDDWSAMTRLPHQPRSSLDRDLDALGNGGRPLARDLQAVAAFLTQLRDLGDRPAPPPSAELASVLDRGFAPAIPTPATTSAASAASAARRSTRPALSSWLRRGALAFGLSAGLSASLVGAAAATGQLPDGAREVVDRIVEAVTPFDVRGGSAREPLSTVDDSPAPAPSPGADGHSTGTVSTFGYDTSAKDGVRGRGPGEKSGRTEHGGDSAAESDAEPPESAGREDRSGRSDGYSDDADYDDETEPAADADSDGEAEDDSGEGSDEGESPAGGDGSEDGEESGAEPDQAE